MASSRFSIKPSTAGSGAPRSSARPTHANTPTTADREVSVGSRLGDARPARAVARGQRPAIALPRTLGRTCPRPSTGGARRRDFAPGPGGTAHAVDRDGNPPAREASPIATIQREAPPSCPVVELEDPVHRRIQVAHRDGAGVPATDLQPRPPASWRAGDVRVARRRRRGAARFRIPAGVPPRARRGTFASRRDVSSPLSRNAELLDPSADASSSSSTDRSSHGTTPMAWSEVTAYARGARTPPSAPGRASGDAHRAGGFASRMNGGERRRAATAVTSFGHRVDTSSVCTAGPDVHAALDGDPDDSPDAADEAYAERRLQMAGRCQEHREAVRAEHLDARVDAHGEQTLHGVVIHARRAVQAPVFGHDARRQGRGRRATWTARPRRAPR